MIWAFDSSAPLGGLWFWFPFGEVRLLAGTVLVLVIVAALDPVPTRLWDRDNFSCSISRCNRSITASFSYPVIALGVMVQRAKVGIAAPTCIFRWPSPDTVTAPVVNIVQLGVCHIPAPSPRPARALSSSGSPSSPMYPDPVTGSTTLSVRMPRLQESVTNCQFEPAPYNEKKYSTSGQSSKSQ